MATSFPSSADSFTNPSASDELDDEVGSRTHSEMHADLNDGMEAVQAYLLSGTGIEGWHYIGAAAEPAFENSWANLGFGQPAGAYRKAGSAVWLSGVFSGGSLGSTIFTLPAGYRPSQTAFVPAFYADGLGANRFGVFTVTTAGAVAPVNDGSGYGLVGTYEGLGRFSLDPPNAA